MIARDDGTPDFHALRSQRRGHETVLFAFDLIEHDGEDLRDLPLIERKRRLKKLLGRAKRRSIQFVEHLTEDDGPTVFRHVWNWKGSQAGRRALPKRAIEYLGKDEGPGKRGSERRGMALHPTRPNRRAPIIVHSAVGADQ